MRTRKDGFAHSGKTQDYTFSESHRRASIIALWFVMPALVILNGAMLGPLCYSLYISFTQWALHLPGSASEFAGFANYAGVLKDPRFWKSVQVTIVYGVTSVSLELVLGLGFALMLNQDFIGRRVVRSLVLIPMVMTPAAIGMFWKLLYHEQQGVFNFFLVSLGSSRVHWLNLDLALFSTIAMEVWEWTPFFALIMFAGMVSIDITLLEAARVDGASKSQLFWHIALPHLVPFILIGLFFRFTDIIKDFDKIYLLTQGGPGDQTTTLSVYAWEAGFRPLEFARTSAISWLFAVFMFVLMLPLLRFMYTRMKG